MVGVGVSCIGDLDVSTFSNFEADRFIFLLGAMEIVFKAWKGKSERDVWEGKTETEEVSEQEMRFIHKYSTRHLYFI